MARADRQWGVVSRAQLLAIGVAASAVDFWVRSRRLQVVHRGVYAVGHARLRVEGRRLAAVLACGPGAVLSHRSAAAHWGLLSTQQQPIDVTARRGRRNAPGIRAHSSHSLDAQDTTRHEGIPTTTVSRTLLDIAASSRASDLERALAQAEILRLHDHRAITDVLARFNGHRGRGALAGAITAEPTPTNLSELAPETDENSNRLHRSNLCGAGSTADAGDTPSLSAASRPRARPEGGARRRGRGRQRRTALRRVRALLHH